MPNLLPGLKTEPEWPAIHQTEGLGSKKNKELGMKIASECPLEGCPSPPRQPSPPGSALSHVDLRSIKTAEENKTLEP